MSLSSLLSRWPLHPLYPALRYVLALICGVGLVFSFAPYAQRPLAVLCLLPLFWLWGQAPRRQAMGLGYAFGLGFFGAGVSWVYYSLHLFGEAIAPLAALLTALFVAFLALYPALLGAVIASLRPRHQGLTWLLVIPALWVLFEWWRGWFLTGFPWLLLGHSQVDTPLGGYAPVLGVYGVSLLVATLAGALVWGLNDIKRRALPAAALVALIWAGGYGLQMRAWTQPDAVSLQVALLQGNVAQETKWQAEGLEISMAVYAELHQQALGSDLIVWPETAIPTFYDEILEDYLLPLAEQARAHGGETLVGIFVYEPLRQHIYNSIVHLGGSPYVYAPHAYHKRHLVPFGEYLPGRSLLMWLNAWLEIPMSDLDVGTAAPVLTVGEIPLGLSVCYEGAFGEQVIEALPQARVLVNVSNDAWFGDSIAPHQHLEIARMRSLETGRPMLRATNTGISAVIDYDGRLIARSPQFTTHLLQAEIYPRQGATPYSKLSNMPVLGWLFTVLGGLLWWRWRRGQ
ncbi:apolipoprotein N-acyltransferase [Thiorhodospira sibirica]|uniref:apolipoprotein N-acyltransferase n=1 Tax=Thiorhodospira sibirica TaxID=154347 RepID=UPI00022C11B0|nr:apolipoprotein N-acyltransferase [Thiorhodospira sibirica]